MNDIDIVLAALAISGWVAFGAVALIMDGVSRTTARSQLDLIASLQAALRKEIARTDAFAKMVDTQHKPGMRR